MIDELSQFSLGLDPVLNFINWHKEALGSEDNADAFTLSTFNKTANRPESRTILYKGMNESNLIFYSNYLSHKGLQLENNPEVSMLFYWHKSIRQVRIQGKVTKANSKDSTNYFHSRDRESQLASYISNQSTPIASKDLLIKKLEEAKAKFEGSEVERPPHWGGYLIEPYEFEFFIYGKNRLNDRFLFEKENSNWKVSRLQP